MMERIQFKSDGQKIRGTLFTPERKKDKNPGVIFFHGMTSSEKNYLPIAERLAQLGIVGMTLSIRGHGNSEGDFDKLTINDAATDGLNAYDFFAQYDFIDLKRIGLCGASVGATIAALVSGQREIQSLVLRAPATYTDEMMEMTYQQIMTEEKQLFKKISNINQTSPLEAVGRFTGSLLVITSENDTIIPVSIPAKFLSNTKNVRQKGLIEIKGATHNLIDDRWREKFVKETIGWFVETLK